MLTGLCAIYIAPGCSKYVTYEGRDWHAECFLCAKCGSALAGKGFFASPTTAPEAPPELLCSECAN